MSTVDRTTWCSPLLLAGREKHLIHPQVKAALRNAKRRPGHAITAKAKRPDVQGPFRVCDAVDSRSRVSTTLLTPEVSRQNLYQPCQGVVITAGLLGPMSMVMVMVVVVVVAVLLPESLPAVHS